MLDVDRLAKNLVLGALLEALGDYELVAHWTQGEFHHDVVVRAAGEVLVIATNCNGGVKEVLALSDVPDRRALWDHRCSSAPLAIRARATTQHWFDPCELLGPDARSELRPEHRVRQEGGGWRVR